MAATSIKTKRVNLCATFLSSCSPTAEAKQNNQTCVAHAAASRKTKSMNQCTTFISSIVETKQSTCVVGPQANKQQKQPVYTIFPPTRKQNNTINLCSVAASRKTKSNQPVHNILFTVSPLQKQNKNNQPAWHGCKQKPKNPACVQCLLPPLQKTINLHGNHSCKQVNQKSACVQSFLLHWFHHINKTKQEVEANQKTKKIMSI